MSKTVITAQPGTPFIDVEREFDATPEQLYRASTDPALLPQWLGPAELQMFVEEYDVRSGGGYRYIQKAPDGSEFAFRGVFHTVRPAELTIQTFEFEGVPDQVATETVIYQALDGGRTLMKQHSVFPSVEARDAAVASGMTSGIEESYDRLQALATA